MSNYGTLARAIRTGAHGTKAAYESVMLTIALALRVLSVSPDAWELVDEIENAMAENCDEYPADSSPIYCDPTIDRD